MTTRQWKGRTHQGLAAGFIYVIFISVLVEQGLERLLDGSMVIGATLTGIALVGIVIGIRYRRVIRGIRTISLDDTSLAVEGWGRHRLGTSPLLAAPWGSEDYPQLGTVLFVRFEDGEVRSLTVPALLSDDDYADEPSVDGDVYLGASSRGAHLLEMLRPFVIPRRLEARSSPVRTYTLQLRGAGKTRSIILLSGDTVALYTSDGQRMFATDSARNLVFTCYRHAQGYTKTPFKIAAHLALMLTFPSAGVTLSVGTPTPFNETLWTHLPTGPAPDYDVGYGAFMKLVEILCDTPKNHSRPCPPFQ